MIVRKLNYEPEDGDIVVINCREANLINGDTGEVYQTGDTLDEFIVKRVIAKEGDTIDIDFANNSVTVNGTVLDETYTSSPILYDGGAFTYPLTVPEGYVFAMGDNRSVSLDSRDVRVGLVRKEMIYGKVLHSFKTLSPFAKKD
jgi:signal peptidase I